MRDWRRGVKRASLTLGACALVGIVGLSVLSVWEPLVWQGGGTLGGGFIMVRCSLVNGQLSMQIGEFKSRIGFDDVSVRYRKSPKPKTVEGGSPLWVFAKFRAYYRGTVPWHVAHPEVLSAPNGYVYDRVRVWYEYYVSYLTMPTALLIVLMVAPFATRRTYRWRVRRRRRRLGLCEACGYDIRHAPAPVCPECGSATNLSSAAAFTNNRPRDAIRND